MPFCSSMILKKNFYETKAHYCDINRELMCNVQNEQARKKRMLMNIKVLFLAVVLLLSSSCFKENEKVVILTEDENNFGEIKSDMTEEEKRAFGKAFGSLYFYDALNDDFSEEKAFATQERIANGKTVDEIKQISHEIFANVLNKGCNPYSLDFYSDCPKILVDKNGNRGPEEIKKKEEKESYIKKISLKNVSVSSKEKISGTIINNGERTLRVVTLIVFFLNEEGIVIGEKDYHPVFVTEYSKGDDKKPLKPNYVKDFGYWVKNHAPSSWGQEIKIEIKNIEFQD